MKRRVFCTLVSICLVIAIGFVACKAKEEGNTAAKKEAESVARSWLNLIDSGDYAKSWDEAAGYFQKAIAKEQWVKDLDAVRKPLGGVVSRKLLSAQYVTQLPGAPDGEYVVFEFKTSYDKKKDSVETITPMKCKDGKWKVAGFYIK